jgi:hypothetical protein
VPTWLAIAIPSVIAVAACLMWAVDYSKKAHEIEKLRLELEKLQRKQEQVERDAARKDPGLRTNAVVSKQEIEEAIALAAEKDRR